MSAPPYKKMTKAAARTLVGKSVVFTDPMIGIQRLEDQSAALFSINPGDCALILDCRIGNCPTGLSVVYTLLIKEALVEFDGRRFFRSWTEKSVFEKSRNENPCAEILLAGKSSQKQKKPRSRLVKMPPAVTFLD